MMKQLVITALVFGTSLTAGIASAYTINDTTWVLEGHSRSNQYSNNGPYSNGWQDVIGDPAVFEVFGVNISRASGQITFDLFANLSTSAMSVVTGSGTYYYHMADFAIDANRDGTFEYGVVLKDHSLWTGLVGTGVVNAGGPGSLGVGLYSGVTWNNSSYYNEESPGTGGVGYGEKYAHGSAILDPLVGVGGGTLVQTISLGTDVSQHKYSFTLNESDLVGLSSSGPAIFWAGPTCANDAIAGAPVPEPATMLLLGSGLAGLLGAKRRSSKKA